MYRFENGELVRDGVGSPEMAADWLLRMRKLPSAPGALVVPVPPSFFKTSRFLLGALTSETN